MPKCKCKNWDGKENGKAAKLISPCKNKKFPVCNGEKLFIFEYVFMIKQLIFSFFFIGACKDGSTPTINENMNDKMCKNGSDNKVVQAFNLII